MINVRNGKGTLEEKIFELVCEYGALKDTQIMQYFDIDAAKLEKMAVKLIKKGRLKYDRQNGYVRIPVQKEYDDNLIRCFWVVLDLKEKVEFHGVGRYPLYVAMYADAKAYEVYCCKKGDEIALTHGLAMLKEKAEGKVLIVIEDMDQIQRIDLEDCTFCMVDAEGGVKYFE